MKKKRESNLKRRSAAGRGGRSPFPESNRLAGRLRILCRSLLPFLLSAVSSGLWRVKGRLVQGYLRASAFFARRRLHAPAFLAASLLISAAAVFLSVFTMGTTVMYNGRALGVVSTPTDAEAAVTGVEEELSSVLGDFTIDMSLVSYSTGLVSRRSVVDEAELEDTLSDQFDLVTYAYSLYIDGELIGATRNRQALEALLEQVKAPYLNENTQSVEFLEEVEIREGYVPNTEICNLGDIVLRINETKTGEVTYTAVKGDSYYAIAQDHGLTVDELLALNPGFDENRLMIGDELVISNAVPYLTVQVTQYEYYEADIPYEVEYIDDSSMWEGDTSVVTKGVYGTADTTALVTYVNSEEISREIVEQVVVSEPQTAVYKRGTAPRPSWAPTGTFRWPTNGSITSRYGYRYIFGSSDFHTGLDIANRRGTNVCAADGGVVVTAGWSGSYGYLVVIDHQNGYRTYYAHNSSLLVSVGDKVFKGEHIAEMGSTGRATGSHCHFEVRYNGQTQNPLNYLP